MTRTRIRIHKLAFVILVVAITAALPGTAAATEEYEERGITAFSAQSEYPSYPAYGHGALWAVHPIDDVVTRIDRSTGEVRSILGPLCEQEVCGTTTVEIGDRDVWVGGTDGTIRRLDPETGEIESRDFVAYGVFDIEETETSLWVSAVRNGFHRGAVYRVDPITRTVLSRVGFREPPMLAETKGAVWALTWNGRLSKIDALTATVSARFHVGDAVDLDATRRKVYVSGADGVVKRFDASSGALLDRALVFARGYGHIAVRGDSLWAIKEPTGSGGYAQLVGLDARSLEPMGRAYINGSGLDIALDKDGSVWLTAMLEGLVLRYDPNHFGC